MLKLSPLASFLLSEIRRPFSAASTSLKPKNIFPVLKTPAATAAQLEIERKEAEEKAKNFQSFYQQVMSGNDKIRWHPESKQGIGPS